MKSIRLRFSVLQSGLQVLAPVLRHPAEVEGHPVVSSPCVGNKCWVVDLLGAEVTEHYLVSDAFGAAFITDAR